MIQINRSIIKSSNTKHDEETLKFIQRIREDTVAGIRNWEPTKAKELSISFRGEAFAARYLSAYGSDIEESDDVLIVIGYANPGSVDPTTVDLVVADVKTKQATLLCSSEDVTLEARAELMGIFGMARS